MADYEVAQASRAKMLLLVEQLPAVHLAGALVAQARRLDVGFTLQAESGGEYLALVQLGESGIRFDVGNGIHGELHPTFRLDDDSLRTNATNRPIDVEAALRLLRVAFRSAGEARIIVDDDQEEEELFVVDPDVFEMLAFEHQT